MYIIYIDFWTSFAVFGDPNGDYGINGYKHRVDIPYWPEVSGELYMKGIIYI